MFRKVRSAETFLRAAFIPKVIRVVFKRDEFFIMGIESYILIGIATFRFIRPPPENFNRGPGFCYIAVDSIFSFIHILPFHFQKPIARHVT